MTTLIRNFNKLVATRTFADVNTYQIPHTLHGVIVSCNDIETVYNASTMFACLGVDVKGFMTFTDEFI